MAYTLIEGTARTVSRWAGGSSSQICIYPETAQYQKRDFLFRVSTATADTDEPAPYTPLPGVTRHLLMLQGSAAVHHEGHYSLTMTPYREIDVFDGGWDSSAAGKVQDFNLMCRGTCRGELSVLTEDTVLSCDGWTHLLLYCGQGDACVLVGDESISLKAEDALLLTKEPGCRVMLPHATVVCAKITV